MGLSDASGVFGGPYLCARAYGGRAAINWATGPGWRRVCWALIMLGVALIAKNIPKNQCHPRYWRQAAGPCRGGPPGRHGTGNAFSRRGRLWPPRGHGRGQRRNRRASSLCPLGTPHRMCWTAHEVPGQSGKTPKFASAPALFRPRVNPEGKHSRREGGDPSRAT